MGGSGDTPKKTRKIAIVGAGLVGALNACFLAKRGYQVELFELRQDPRTCEHVKGRSINLALSERGCAALRHVGLEEKVVEKSVRMYGRMCHGTEGNRWTSLYGKDNQYLMSVERRRLNEELLTAAEVIQNVNIHFGMKLVGSNVEKGELTFRDCNKNEDIKVHADLIIGTDGAYSTVRRDMMKRTRFNFNQEYIPHGYKEFCIQPKDGECAMEQNYLHIWPRNTFMMIALPNLDKSFTVTLFMPFDSYNEIRTEDQLMAFFNDKFHDAIPLLGEDAIKKMFFKSKALPMVAVKCNPHHYEGKVLLMGDASHAIVPFYGQGMNAGFEDCLVLEEALDECNDDFEKALSLYSERRSPDAHAIADLAMYNYVEMRKSVNSRLFFIRKKFDAFMHFIMPDSWIPLYCMVSFTRTRYTDCIKRRQYQDKLINYMLTGVGIGTVAGAAYVTYKLLKNTDASSMSWTGFRPKLT